MSIIVTLILSFIGLIWAANHLVIGAAGIANYYRVSPLIVGLTLVALGTSAPEIMVGIAAALEGENDLALGNAIGSNIANIGLVLGATILIRPLKLRSSVLRREYPLLFLSMLFIYSLMIDGYLGILDGCLLLLGSVALIGYLLILAKRSGNDAYAREVKQLINPKRSVKIHIMSLIFGLIFLPLSASYLVKSAVELASLFGISELIIGLTVVAFATSLPQAVTSIVAAIRGQDDIAVGNILGSNMFILLVVMAFPSIINPSAISHAILWRDIPVLFVVTALLLWLNYREKSKITRWHGGLLLLIYFSYIVSLIVHAL
ncbi:calcium/sodium antiporter [Legionella septentrionalis]|uniref:Calcium/sodium antiporter n=1 Tax=Legionella septentrionalis TaxID=2498109 RepID=A0A433JGR1_9GAMM|nr:calcium/sodium antiporter [Legionella septentrionalis]RUQ81002.1 calcium/sodium antiporter [Legionella septentrionalis]